MSSNFSDLKLNLIEMQPVIPFFTGHTQTILGHLVPSVTTNQNYQEHVLKLHDGDELHLYYLDVGGPFTVVLGHGLGGDTDADYIRRSADLAILRGWNAVLINHRMASPKAKAKKSYHSGRGEDFSAVLEWSKRKFTNSRHIAVGFSMSGSILLNLLTKRRGSEQPDYGVVVNAPLDLKSAAMKLSEGFSRSYDIRFFYNLKKLIETDPQFKLPAWGRTHDIDVLYTSKVNGFRDADDYYETCSAFPYVNEIRTPTFVLSAKDDPFIDVNLYLKADWSNSVHLTIQEYGGHMGYFNKIKDPKYGRRWLDHYLGSVFDRIKELT